MTISLCSIYGVVVISLIIVAIQTQLDLTQDQSRAFLTLNRLQIRSDISSVAQTIVQQVGKLYLNRFQSNQEKLLAVQLLKKNQQTFGILKRLHTNSVDEGMKDALNHQLMKINSGLIDIKQIMVTHMEKYKDQNTYCKEFFIKHDEEQEKIEHEVIKASNTRRRTSLKNLQEIFMVPKKDTHSGT